jgi:BirA family biotin operon repressor/biotin-[acetyl-CoA-carboxylase] ligase
MGEVDGTGRGRFAEVRRVAETGSTNRDLLEAAADGAPDRTVLVAAHQTAGRGRRDRTWSAPPGASLLVSVLLRPTLSPERLFLLTMACGLAAVEAADQVAGVRLGLKWPNDLVAVAAPGLDPAAVDRKAGGILAESLVVDDRVEAVVVGMGLNVDWPFPLPEDLAAIATSLDRLAGAPVDLEAVLASWLDRYGALLDDLEDGDGSGVLERARSVSATVGRTVEVVLADRTFRGRASAIADSGHLLVDHDGVTEDVAVGDVVHARLAD